MGKKIQTLDTWFNEKLRAGKYKDFTSCAKGIAHLKTNETNKKQALKYAKMFYEDPTSLPSKFFPDDPEPTTIVRTPRTGRKAKVEDMPSLEGDVIPVPAGGALFQQEAMARLSYLREMIQIGVRILDGFKAAWDVNKNLDLSEMQGVVNTLSTLQAAYEMEVRRAAPFLMTPITGTMIPSFPLPAVVPPVAPALGPSSVPTAQELDTLRSTRPPFLPPPPSH